MKKLDIKQGDKFGYLTIIKEAEPKVYKCGQKGRIFLCQCVCGKIKEVPLLRLRNKQTSSCGCLNKQIVSKTKKKYNRYEIDGDTVKVFDSKNNYCLIDLEDLEKVKKFYFYKNHNGYFVNKYLKMRLHRIILNCPQNKVIDHINGDISDNRKNNLRICTQQQNNMNRKGKGYYWDKKRGKWHVQIGVKGKIIFIGRFNSEEEAKNASLKAKKFISGNLLVKKRGASAPLFLLPFVSIRLCAVASAINMNKADNHAKPKVFIGDNCFYLFHYFTPF